MAESLNLTALGPRQAKAVKDALSAFNWESKTFTDLYGTHGKPETERRTVATSPFSQPRADAAGILDAVLIAHEHKATPTTYAAFVSDIQKATAQLAATRPVHDCRITAEDIAERNRIMAEAEAKASAKAAHLATLQKHSYGLAETSRAIKQVLGVLFPGTKFSVRSDSYSGGCSIDTSWTDGPTEAQVKPILDIFERSWFDGMEDLKHYTGPVEWNGHLFDFCGDSARGSRGDSAALLTEAAERFSRETGLPVPEVVSDGRYSHVKHDDKPCGWSFFTSQPDDYPEGVLCRDECRYDSAARIVNQIARYTSKESPAIPFVTDWPEGTPEPENSIRSIVFRILLGEIGKPGVAPTTTAAPVAVAGATLTENNEKDGLELRFPSKPDVLVLGSLKANGWRWSRFSSCWYHKRTDQARRFAELLAGNAPQPLEPTPNDTERAPVAEDEMPAAPAVKQARKAIPPEVLAVLRDSRTEGNMLFLPPGQLPRDQYEAVNKYLEILGGKWNRKARGHVFISDAGELLSAALSDGEVTDWKKTYQLFPTPAPLAARMVKEANIPVCDPDFRLLEPSAGTGAILDQVFTCGGTITAVEINPKLAESMRQKWAAVDVRCADFLTCNGDLGKFDRILMNPPFANGADIQHIRHAIKFLKPGGRLVAICANGPRQQRELQPIATTWEPLPADTFKESGTGVNAVLMTVEAR
ncbi:MAG: methyltransferase [Acidobacteriales bacterium]|nr:methyltransferase [Terriglobales bacterium]